MATKNKVNFVHFSGKENTWQSNIDSSKWANSIVFGKVWDNGQKCNLKIYAGKDSVDSSDYIYDMASLQEFVEVEKLIKDIQEFLAVDASNNFTNEKMKSALENFISGSKTVNDIKDELASLEDYIDDALAGIDISINNLTLVILQAINWMDESGWIDPDTF